MSSVTRRARKSLVWLLVILFGFGGIITWGVLGADREITPGLALDLAGGTQIVLKAVNADGSAIEPEVLSQAVEVIRRRVDGSGVAEAEITTQGTDNIVVAIPGEASQETLDLISQSAQLQFRSVIYAGLPNDAAEPLIPDTATDELADTPSAYSWVTDQVKADYAALDCTLEASLQGGDLGDPNAAFVACRDDGSEKLILGPVEVTGDQLADATSGPAINSSGNIVAGQYQVDLEFTSDGATAFGNVTKRLFGVSGDRNRFAMVLDGVVISPPTVNAIILTGNATISGSFTTPESAATLANQLKYGALPITLEYQSKETIAATLGADQLQKGLLAGLIGLILVVIYSLIQYRALGFVTIASLVVAAALTYGSIWTLSWTIGYRLSLAGIAGLIVAIGITADSFIVYFERVRDELREGRSLTASVDHGWTRARRTILASDAVSFLAAVVLYMTAVGSVRGFAFTLGLTTLIDLMVVTLFTHPMLVLLAKTRFFGQGHPWSGFDPRQLGREAIYQGRGRVRITPTPAGPTLAERRAAERRAAPKDGDAK